MLAAVGLSFILCSAHNSHHMVCSGEVESHAVSAVHSHHLIVGSVALRLALWPKCSTAERQEFIRGVGLCKSVHCTELHSSGDGLQEASWQLFCSGITCIEAFPQCLPMFACLACM